VCSTVPTIASCPGCVFGYTNEMWWYTGEEQTTLTSDQYKENYNDVISESGVNHFLGMILDENSKIERAFACGILTKETKEIPFCIEGATDGSTEEDNKELLTSIFGEYDDEADLGCYYSKLEDDNRFFCVGPTVRAIVTSDSVSVDGRGSGMSECNIFDGHLICIEGSGK